MAKHKRVWNEDVYRKRIDEGRGQGFGTDYIPWIMIQDFASKGMVSRMRGTKTGRVHHLLSNHEMYFFYLLDWSDDVIDIREQYPLLDLRLAIEISEHLGIRYPYDKISGFPYVLTSDFFIKTKSGVCVRTIKTSSELQSLRVREKLEIERRYWHKQNVDWKIVTENEINREKARNIEWLAQARDLECLCIPTRMQSTCLNYFLDRFSTSRPYLCDLFYDVEHRFSLASGTGLNIFKHLVYWKKIEADVCSIMEKVA